MKINFNMSAVFANDYLRKSDDALSSSIERLSSGFKINHAKDNPSGIAIAKRMNAQIRGLSTASQSASDGISVIEIAEGALTEVHDMLQRMNELSIKASNGTMSENDRKTVQEEVDALREEITRVAETTEFNGSTLLDGTYDLKGYVGQSKDDSAGSANKPSTVKISSYADEVKTGFYDVELNARVDLTSGVVSVTGVAVTDVKSAMTPLITASAAVSTPSITGAGTTPTITGAAPVVSIADSAVIKIQNPEINNGRITIEGDNGFSLTLKVDLDEMLARAAAENKTSFNTWCTLDLTGYGAMTMQIGANEGQTLDIRIPTVSSETLGIEDLDVTTQDSAKEAIEKIAGAIDEVSSIRSRLGAYQNRLEHTISSLDINVENTTAAYSRIMDTDMAEEMTQYTQQQVLSQAGTTILAQANERPSQILQLLQ